MGVIIRRRHQRADTGVSEDIREHLDMDEPTPINDIVELAEALEHNKHVVTLLTVWLRLKSGISKPTTGMVKYAHSFWRDELTELVTYRMNHKNKAACKNMFRASLGVAIMEAMKIDHEMAVAFLESTTFPDGPCQSARMLREWLLRNPATKGLAYQILSYRIAWAAIEAFRDSRPIKLLRPLNRAISDIGVPISNLREHSNGK